MNPEGYKRPKRTAGDINIPVKFLGAKPAPGPYPGETVDTELFRTWASVDEVWTKDIELAKSTGTLTDVTIYIRDPRGDYMPDNRDYFEIDAQGYHGKQYAIEDVKPNLRDRRLVRIVGRLKA